MKGTLMAITNEVKRDGIKPIGWRLDRWDSLYVSLVPLPAAFIVATLVSDVLYCAVGGAFWSLTSEWLLGAGLATGAFAAADGLIRYIASGGIQPSRICWTHVTGNVLASVLSLSNLVYRLNEERDHAVVPAGIALTAIAVCLLLLTAQLNRDMAMQGGTDELDESEPIWDEVATPALAADATSAPHAESYPVLSDLLARGRTVDRTSVPPAQSCPVTFEDSELLEPDSAAPADPAPIASEVEATVAVAGGISTVPCEPEPAWAEDAAPTWPLGGLGAAPAELDAIWGAGTFAPWPSSAIGTGSPEPDPIGDEDLAPAFARRASAGRPAVTPPASAKLRRVSKSAPVSASRPRKRPGESPAAVPAVAARPAAPARKRRAARPRPVTQC
ncbi:MAG TPA: DUF2231 domain-containing protein [Burkholderiaceae bacterium]|nr:DUF2231 domain-containing protein [Burkholderiaceae bacterium]